MSSLLAAASPGRRCSIGIVSPHGTPDGQSTHAATATIPAKTARSAISTVSIAEHEHVLVSLWAYNNQVNLFPWQHRSINLNYLLGSLLHQPR
jgi:hypothetical protein